MRYPIVLLLACFAGCASLPRHASIDGSVAEAITSRYHLPAPPVFLKDPQNCSPAALSNVATVLLASLNSATFADSYPSGVFVLCDVQESGARATAKLQRLLQHAGDIKVSQSGTITLRGGNGSWHVSHWDVTAFDYL
jgi:hypothetical protein